MKMGLFVLIGGSFAWVLAACAPAPEFALTNETFLVFFDEFSANLPPDARRIIDQAADQARRGNVHVLSIVARASTAASPDAGMKLAETRAAVVRDALLADGIAPTMIRLLAVGRAGATDADVGARRVDIISDR